MTQSRTRKVVSAKNAKDGDTVYLTSCDAWSRDIEVAELLAQDDFDWRLAFANRLKEVVNPILIAAREGSHGLPELVAS